MYFNYHAKAKKLIREGRFVEGVICEDWNGIRPTLVLFFRDAPPMPIRIPHWAEYAELLGITLECPLESATRPTQSKNGASDLRGDHR